MNRISRREFLSKASAAMLTSLAAGSPLSAFASRESKLPTLFEPKADHVIVLWLAGGMPHTDTFDPKAYQKFEKGVDSRKLLSTFPAIPSAVDGLMLSQGLEEVASIMDRAAVIRSMKFADLGPILHTRHQFHWHTGYTPPLTVLAPHIGAMISKTLGPVDPDIPAYIDVGQRLDAGGADELKSFMTAGFLGAEHGPMFIPFPSKAAQVIQPPRGVKPGRFQNRYQLYKRLADASPITEYGSDYHKASLLRSVEKAFELVSAPKADAFDLSKEPEKSFQKYNVSRFGRGCLLARRLVEAGARFIEVSSEYIPFGNWDTHKDGHERTVKLKQDADQPIAQLVRDLEERGLLDRTLIVIASEFSRVAGRNPGKAERDTDIVVTKEAQYGIHRHFTGGGSVVLIGAGIKPGTVYGKTSDEFPCETVENPVTISDLHATIYHILGIPPDFSYDIEQRPFYVTNLGKGVPVKGVLA